MNAAKIEILTQINMRLENTPFKERGLVYQWGAEQLKVSVRTVHNWLKKVAVKAERKQRSDAGNRTLPLNEAKLISALLLESMRRNGKQLSSIKLAVERLRANGKIIAGTLDKETGKIIPLSISSITRALYAYKLHPSQLLAPSPVTELASLHPNHVWQIDASVSAQYYINEQGTQALDKKVHYLGKVDNLAKVIKQLLTRYVITDHTSGAVYVEYVTGGETSENICNCLINAMQQRGNMPFYGVPFKLMTDPGAAMGSAVFRNLCKNMSIDLIINEAGNARAKGQVENGNNLVEREFESGLKLVEQVTSLEELNRLARQWMLHFNATNIHSRHKKTRYGAWSLIKQDQLRIAPSVDICRDLTISAPLERKVTLKLRVNFNSNEYDVSQIPNVIVGEKLLVARNPWKGIESANIVLKNSEGRDCFYEVPLVTKNEYGFADTAAIIGESYFRPADTITDSHRKELEQLITGTHSEAEAKAARKAKKVPFNGEIDPFKHITDTTLPSYLPKRGNELETLIELPQIVESNLDIPTLAKQLKRLLGDWSPELMAWLKKEYPNGAPESTLNTIIERINKRPRLSVVGA